MVECSQKASVGEGYGSVRRRGPAGERGVRSFEGDLLPAKSFLRLLAVFVTATLCGSCCPWKPGKPPRAPVCRREADAPAKTSGRLPECVRLDKVVAKTFPGSSNIWLMFRLLTCDVWAPKGVTEAAPREFDISEDGRPVSRPASQQVVLPHAVGSRLYVLLLLDMSGGVRKGGHTAHLQARARDFVNHLAQHADMAVAVFDGSGNIHLLQDYTGDVELLAAAVDRLAGWTGRDPSTNLYGAYVKGLEHIETRTSGNVLQIARGTLVLVTASPDQATRMTRAQAVAEGRKRVQGRRTVDVYTVGVGPDVDGNDVRELAVVPANHRLFKSWKEFDRTQIERLCGQVVAVHRSYRVLSYCSLKRAGKHTVRILVDPKQARTLKPLEYEFDATGFAAGCKADAAIHDPRLAACGVGDKMCRHGYRCLDRRCLPEEYVARKEKSEAERRRRSLAEGKRTGLKQYAGCLEKQVEVAALKTTYKAKLREYERSDCGPRFLLEGGTSFYPKPRGVAGLVMFGWALPRWVEFHGGVGIAHPVYTVVAQARIKPYSWRFLDLIVVPRFAVGVTSKPRTYEAELLVGARFRIGRHLAVYANLGPGYAKAVVDRTESEKATFVLPAWLGTEVRF